MNLDKTVLGGNSPYVAFKDDRQRKWALISRDIRWVLVALSFAVSNGGPMQWRFLWKFITGG